jgi:uncharacterized protein with PIN domain
MQFADNECMKCKHRWLDRPGVYAEFQECPKCGSLYWKWLNFEDFTK